jgi:hypothetical protein
VTGQQRICWSEVTAGALTGVIFVALSFTFDQVMADEVWLGRAATLLIILAQPLACMPPTVVTINAQSCGSARGPR